MLVLVADILFISLVGEAEDHSDLDATLQGIAWLHPVYDHLDVIGFRSAAKIL